MFAELASTTNFTFLTGASHPEEMVLRAAELGLGAIAITDRNSLAGVVRAHVRLKELRRERVTVKPRNITGSDVREHAAKIRSQVRIDPSSRQPDLAPGAQMSRAVPGQDPGPPEDRANGPGSSPGRVFTGLSPRKPSQPHTLWVLNWPLRAGRSPPTTL